MSRSKLGGTSCVHDGDAVTAHLVAMTSEQHRWLNLYENLGSEVWTRACAGSYANRLIWNSNTGPVDCANLIEQWRTAAQWGVDAAGNADAQRLELENAFACKTGEIDAATCAAYRGAISATNESMHETMTEVIDNLGATCTRYYDTYGAYLGCR